MSVGASRVLRPWYLAQPVGVVALPLWLLLGLIGSGVSALGAVGVVLYAIVLFVVLGVVTLLVYVRPDVRAERQLAWRDVAVFAAIDAAAIWLGFYRATAAVAAWALAVALMVGVVLAVRWLVLGWRDRMRQQADRMRGPAEPQAIDVGELTIIEVDEDGAERRQP